MELQHVNVKIPVDGELTVDPRLFIDVFHQWIREDVLGELLIDVADYRHVPNGPGVLLVGHESDYSLDHTGGVWGLRYNRKAPLAGRNGDRFTHALHCAARACRLLESRLATDGPLKFSRKTFELFINDRAFALNTAETWSACEPELSAYLDRLLGQGAYALDRHTDRRTRFGFSATTAQDLFDAVQRFQAGSARPDADDVEVPTVQ